MTRQLDMSSRGPLSTVAESWPDPSDVTLRPTERKMLPLWPTNPMASPTKFACASGI